ncbi:Far1-related sequence 5-like [Thalictrum thalictroides]|uniref:Far1-related sequence 5-like n=1 Tax=Thalictrum thalictroides TaxID=46969 RepID=A0A7J6VTN8_THATH|nr:Far1-related sequence 5-like [Thalictrum thalictroides]
MGREMLEPDVVFDESIHEPEDLHLQGSPSRDGNIAETSGRDECNALLIKFGSLPYIGLEFCSEGEAYEYYRACAKENGFSIRKSHVERSRVDHSLISRKFVCVKQGFRSLKDKRYEGKIVRHRRVTRVDCRAAMIIKRRSGKWVVHRFHKEHNHELGEPANSSELQSHQEMTTATKSILEALYKTQCIDIEDNISHGQKTVEDNVEVFDFNPQELRRFTYKGESPNKDVKMADSSGREGNYAKGSPTTADSNDRVDNDASLMKLGSEPYLGLQFGSQDEAYEFYNAYAKEKGFSIRKSRIERSRIDHSMISRLYVCANQGLRSTKDKRYEGKIVRPRQETRLDCRAAMFIKRRSGKWVVERFHKEHNHDLVDPTKAEKLRSHRKMTMATKSMIEALYKCGVGPSKIVDLLTGVADGAKDILENNGAHDLLGHNEEDSETNMKKERKNNIRIECYNILQEAMRKLSIISVPTVSVQPDNLRCNSNQGEKMDENIDEQGENVWTMDLNITVPDLPRIKSKGRPVSSRIKLGIEQAQKKKRTCGTCKESGHYTRTCPKGTVDQSPASKLGQGPVDQSQTSAMFQGTVDLPHTSRQLQSPVDHSASSAIPHSSFDLSQTSMMLQEHYGQTQIYDML